MLLRNPEMMLLDTFEDPQFIHDLMRLTTDFCKLWGDAIASTDRAKLLRAHRVDQPGLAGQLPGVHRPVPQGTGGALQGQEGRGHHPHLRHHLPDLRGPDRLRLHHDLVRPRPAGRSGAPRRPAPALHGGGPGRAVAIGNVDATMFERLPARRSRPRCAAASTPRPSTRASSCPPRARSRRARAPRSSSGSWTRPTTTAATSASSGKRPEGAPPPFRTSPPSGCAGKAGARMTPRKGFAISWQVAEVRLAGRPVGGRAPGGVVGVASGREGEGGRGPLGHGDDLVVAEAPLAEPGHEEPGDGGQAPDAERPLPRRRAGQRSERRASPSRETRARSRATPPAPPGPLRRELAGASCGGGRCAS